MSARDPSATVLDFVSPGLEDDFLQSRDISAASLFLNPSTPRYSNMVQQTIPSVFKGAATFGGHLYFDIPAYGDRIPWMAIEVDLNSWLPEHVLYYLARGSYAYTDPSGSWTWANSLGTTMVERVWIEAGGQEIDGFPGEWIDIWVRLFLKPEISAVWRRECLGSLSPDECRTFRPRDYFPTEGRGRIIIPIPTWCLRQGRHASLPLCALKEGSLSLHVKFRPFYECVRSHSGRKPAGCKDTPIGKTYIFEDLRYPFNNIRSITVPPVVPLLKGCRALINYAFIEAEERHTLMHEAFTDLVQPVATFHFEAPLKYAIASSVDNVVVSLPIQAEHPVDEIIWILRRTAVEDNSDWTNYSATLETDASGVRTPILRSATIQVAARPWITETEMFFRSSRAGVHSGQETAAEAFIYHYAFTEAPEAFQPGASVHGAAAPLRLVLDVRQPGTADENRGWQVFVFVLYRNWIRYQNGISAPLFN